MIDVVKLSQINGARLAQQVERALREHLQRLDAAAGDLTLPKRVEALCRYAQSSELGELGDVEGVVDAVRDVVAAIYTAPVQALRGEERGEWWEGIDNGTGLGIVLRVALVRAWIVQGARRIPATWLADVEGITNQALQYHVSRGSLAVEASTVNGKNAYVVTAAAARAFLNRDSTGR